MTEYLDKFFEISFITNKKIISDMYRIRFEFQKGND